MNFQLDYKEILGLASVSIVMVNHIYYLIMTCLKRIRPHAFTLLVYFMVTISVSVGIYFEGDTGAALRMGIPAPMYILMLIMTLRRGVEYIRRIDVVMLSLSLLALPLWWLTDSPRAAILFLALVEGFGIIPAFRKAYHLPYEDSIVSAMVSSTAMLLAFLAVRDPLNSWATAFYLAYWTTLCTAMAILIGWRRYVMSRNNVELKT